MTEVAGEQVASTETDTTDPRDYETEARDMGWVPETEWKGDKKPAKFLDAKDFVERGEHIIPILKSRLDKQEREFRETIAGLKKVTDNTVTQITAMHKAEIESLRQQKTAAVKAGNVALVDKIDEMIEERRDATPTKEEAKDVNTEFAKKHDWYGTDDELTALAVGFSNDVIAAAEKSGKVISMEDMFEIVAKKVEKSAAYKAKFDKPAANGHAAVDGGSENGSTPSKADPLAKLSAVERAQAKEDMKKFPKIYPNGQAWIDAFVS